MLVLLCSGNRPVSEPLGNVITIRSLPDGYRLGAECARRPSEAFHRAYRVPAPRRPLLQPCWALPSDTSQALDTHQIAFSSRGPPFHTLLGTCPRTWLFRATPLFQVDCLYLSPETRPGGHAGWVTLEGGGGWDLRVLEGRPGFFLDLLLKALLP